MSDDKSEFVQKRQPVSGYWHKLDTRSGRVVARSELRFEGVPDFEAVFPPEPENESACPSSEMKQHQ